MKRLLTTLNCMTKKSLKNDEIVFLILFTNFLMNTNDLNFKIQFWPSVLLMSTKPKLTEYVETTLVLSLVKVTNT